MPDENTVPRSARRRISGAVWLALVGGALLAASYVMRTQRGEIARAEVSAASGAVFDGLRIDPSAVTLVRRGLKAPAVQLLHVRLTNESAENVEVRAITASCGCTVVEKLQNPVLIPGASVELQVRVTIQPYGTRNSRIGIETDQNGGASHSIALTLKGEDLNPPYAELIPDKLEVRGMVAGDTVQREFEVTSTESLDSSPWITGLRSSDVNVRAVVVGEPKSIDRGGAVSRSYRCKLEATIPETNDIAAACVLQLVTRVEGTKPTPPILVSVSHVAPVRAVPRELFFGAEHVAKGPLERTLVLISESGQPFEVEALPTDAP